LVMPLPSGSIATSSGWRKRCDPMQLQAEAAKKQRQEKKEADANRIADFLTEHQFKGINTTKTKFLKTYLPLHSAVMQNDAELVRCLVDAGADRSMKISGLTALELAQKLAGTTDGTYEPVVAVLERDLESTGTEATRIPSTQVSPALDDALLYVQESWLTKDFSAICIYQFRVDGMLHKVAIGHKKGVWQLRCDGEDVGKPGFPDSHGEDGLTTEKFFMNFNVRGSDGHEIIASLRISWSKAMFSKGAWSYSLIVNGIRVPECYTRSSGFVRCPVTPEVTRP